MKNTSDLQNPLWFIWAMTRVTFIVAAIMSIALLVSGCHKPQPVPESESPSALLYKAKCDICHPAYHPRAHTLTGWEKVIPRMEKNAESMGMGTLLSEEERSAILGYLGRHARRGY